MTQFLQALPALRPTRLDWHLLSVMLKAMLMVMATLLAVDMLAKSIEQLENKDSIAFIQLAINSAQLSIKHSSQFVPYAALIGALIASGQMAINNELVAMQSAGVSSARITAIAMIAACLFDLTGIFLKEQFKQSEAPWSAHEELSLKKANTQLNKLPFWQREGESFIYVEKLETNGRLHGIAIYRFNEQHNLSSVLSAQQAVYDQDRWILLDAQEKSFDPSGKTNISKSAQLPWETQITPTLLEVTALSEPKHMSLFTLRQHAYYLAKQGLNHHRFSIEFWDQILQPITAMLLAWIALCIAARPMRGRSLGTYLFIGISIGLAFNMTKNLFNLMGVIFELWLPLVVITPIALAAACNIWVKNRLR